MKTLSSVKTIYPWLLISALVSAFAIAATLFDPSSQPIWQSAPFTLKQTDLEAGNTKAYQAWFENTTWQGDIIEYNIATNGARSPGSWTAGTTFEAKEATIIGYWKADDGRKIITYDGQDQVAFRWDQLTLEQRSALDLTTAANVSLAAAYDSPILNYIRGDRSREGHAGIYRTRNSLLGDIIHSQPVHVGSPMSNYWFPGYAAFKNDYISRSGRLYVGANDGMIHVFDTQDGSEVYAYVPSMLLPKLRQLSKTYYTHSYFADGQLTAGDAKIGDDWKTLLTGGLGAGAKGLFALDVTDPNLTAETAATGTNSKILWEKTGTSLGYIYGRPRVALFPDGNWYVVSGNGYGSDNGYAQLYLMPLSGDSITATLINTGVGNGNGLSAPALVDTDYDGIVDYAYAGDLKGNLWRFDLQTNSVRKLFTAGLDKPITSAPEVTYSPFGGQLIYFGTGSLLSQADGENSDQQSIYAIWDKPGSTATVDESDLLVQSLSAATHYGGVDVRIATSNNVDWSSQYGWKLDLPATGERVLGNPQLRAKRLLVVTHNPDRSSWLLGLDWLSGGDVNNIQFDLNENGALDAGDKVTVDETLRVPVGRMLGTGNYSQVTIGHINSGSDILYLNGLTLPDSCVGDCIGGIDGGHIDVDADTELGGSTDTHKHEYDDANNVTYIDYFNMLSGLMSIDVAGIPTDRQFVVIMANADLSPGGVITIGDKKWGVVEYQEMVQRKLAAWDGTSALVDDDGDSLVHTINEITGAGGTIKVSFDGLAIVKGGLHPTQTGCVKDDPNITNGRWRNGALTTHLLDKESILNGDATINAWTAQSPTDLVEDMVAGGLHANLDNDVGFLYESTLFWHFKSVLAKLLGYPDAPCYGDTYYEQTRATEVAGLTADLVASLFPNDAVQIQSLIDQVRSYTCEAGIGAQCTGVTVYEELMDQIENLMGSNFKDLRPYIERGDSGAGITGDSNSGYETKDQSEDLSPVPGPDFNLGRRSWIDL
jgi:hypothetical protein